jgi:hypothetical protein
VCACSRAAVEEACMCSRRAVEEASSSCVDDGGGDQRSREHVAGT